MALALRLTFNRNRKTEGVKKKKRLNVSFFVAASLLLLLSSILGAWLSLSELLATKSHYKNVNLYAVPFFLLLLLLPSLLAQSHIVSHALLMPGTMTPSKADDGIQKKKSYRPKDNKDLIATKVAGSKKWACQGATTTTATMAHYLGSPAAACHTFDELVVL